LKFSKIFLPVLCLLATTLYATNPAPTLNNPLVPDSALPGGASFTLTVNGSNFVAGAVVLWNGSPRSTTFVNNSQLHATISASDIATAGTATVAVSNPAPGGGTSNRAYFTVTHPAPALGLSRTDINFPFDPPVIATADLNGDGKLDLVVGSDTIAQLGVMLGNGDGTFQLQVTYAIPALASYVVLQDFNHDGKLDIFVINFEPSSASVLLGNGNGTFQPSLNSTTGNTPYQAVAGDFNADGNLDIAMTDVFNNLIIILLGKGDGTFQSPASFTAGAFTFNVVTGDFNGDGILDLATGNSFAKTVSLFPGLGNGSFGPATVFPANSKPGAMYAVDMNGDGKLDLITASTNTPSSVSVMLGNGDGTFQPESVFQANYNPDFIISADFNGDNVPDIAVNDISSHTLAVLLGNSDGTLQNRVLYQTPLEPEQIAVGDFNGDGRLDMVVPDHLGNAISIFLQTDAALSADTLTLPKTALGTLSLAKKVDLTNTGTGNLTINSISFTGTNAADFLQSNTCGSTVAPNATCSVRVTFRPLAIDTRSATLQISDSALGSPHTVAVTGVGIPVKVTPVNLNFGNQKVGTTSSPIPITLTNVGKGSLTLGVNGFIDPQFAETNDCGTLGPGGSCTITATFTPTSVGTTLTYVQLTWFKFGFLNVNAQGTGTP
jgi:hypothetical protein